MRNSSRQVILSAWKGAECPPLKATRPCNDAPCPTNCMVAEWSAWSSCTAECDGGVQQRSRRVLTKARNGGSNCPELLDTQMCNTPSCNQDCVLGAWSSWSNCSRACDGGTQLRKREVTQGPVRLGTCPDQNSQDRLELMSCNLLKCSTDEGLRCGDTPLDIVLLVDTSAWGATIEDVRNLTLEIASRYAPHSNGTRISVLAFADDVHVVSGMSEKLTELQDRVDSGLKQLQGAGKLSKGLAMAGSVLRNTGRSDAVSTVLVITGGKIPDSFMARQAAAKIRGQGVRISFVLVGKSYTSGQQLDLLATSPTRENVLELPNWSPEQVRAAAHRVILSTCATFAKAP